MPERETRRAEQRPPTATPPTSRCRSPGRLIMRGACQARTRPVVTGRGGSVAEVADARDEHRRAGGVGDRDDLGVAHRAAGLDEGA